MAGESLSVLAQSGDYHLNLTTELAQTFRASLQHFLVETECQMVALIERSGAVIVSEQSESASGLPRGDSLGVVVAGLFAAAQMMADMLGGDETPEVCCHGKSQHVILTPISDEFALIAVFRDFIAVGAVRYQADKVAEKLKDDLRKVVKSHTAYSRGAAEGNEGEGAGPMTDGPFSRYT